MKTYLDCIPCFIRQGLDSIRLITDDENLHKQIICDVLELAKKIDFHQPPPAIGQLIHRRIRELTQNPDPYKHIKQKHNQMALKLYQTLKPIVLSTNDSIEMAVRLAIAGNIIDLGVKSSISESSIHKTINDSLTAPLDLAAIKQLKTEINKAEKILYLTDNAGEIVFDRLLIEQLPTEKITAAVKGFPVINDATMEDAQTVGLMELVKVIDNGSDGPGTLLKTCSENFLSYFNEADLIISKGQGNYESLSGTDKNIYFLLKAKCPVAATDIGCELGYMVVKSNI